MKTSRFGMLTAMIMAAGAASAADNAWQPFASIGHAHLDDIELDGGGDYRSSAAAVNVGVAGLVGRSTRASFSLQHRYTDYTFADVTALGAARWNDVQETRLASQFSFSGRGNIEYVLSANAGLARENGAETSDSVTYGALAGVVRRFTPERRLGFGFAFQQRPEHGRAMPVALVDWKLTDSLRLINPHAASPTGASGLELAYQTPSPWTLGAGAAYRNDRFRLEDAAAVSGGVVEERAGVLYVRATRPLWRTFGINFYAGTHLAGEIRIEDASGMGVLEQDTESAGFVGAMLTAQF